MCYYTIIIGNYDIIEILIHIQPTLAVLNTNDQRCRSR